jgi:predicted ArsR family transcriptional regulator
VVTETPPVPLGASRAGVLDELRAAGRLVGVDTLAQRLQLHPNTVRFHLDALVQDGLVTRRTEGTRRRGRPRLLFAVADAGPTAGMRNYRLLAEILTTHVATSSADPVDAALRAGREWGRSMARAPGVSRRRPEDAEDEALAQLTDVLTDIGFRPQLVGSRRRIDLHHCPFRELARERGEVVCAVHLGVVQGLLTALDAPVRARRATPFVSPNLCHVHLRAGSETVGTNPLGRA